ncbi:dihydroxy-naphthoyl-CoA hydrolase [Candidatus Rhabdochlamydia oedothoracis]|uniref:Dihydroxy-naphthoyl-CoA hydrolase n=1 Tax=Candidatus Rhabdochlamydia oedothoracis TaxID=2720720 RepID=A0ABX8V0U2_9BACT|nr:MULTISPECIES: thioesterase family protein [Rhabdochlamydia]KAG6559030.1 1,4-dihydroxy-2-naphthoyl-CoA hydrolase [Candidatus Rhabdochlamydia sp. W815]MCL6756255.1 acyl-CoA thioesterase [Candidatus Rhabdochlamydia oedothoracis]QYF48786.1 dihydroxy-naphthoyl-CoA hydrolase [Candidatus Rhabdochlamydia oedothoracis]
MFEYRTQIRMKNTDATGHLFFSEQFNLALEAFEEFLFNRAMDLDQMEMPIVHAEADYKKPLQLRDSLKITLGIKHLGNASFSVSYLLFNLKTQEEVGSVIIVHVCIDSMTKKSIPLPLKLREYLERHLWEKDFLNAALEEE